MASRTWFYLDDFPLVSGAAQDGLTLRSLAEPHIGHVMPAGPAGRLAPRTGGGTLRLHDRYCAARPPLRPGRRGSAVAAAHPLRLPPRRPALLLAYFLFSPWLIQPTSWWAAGINHLPALVATVWTLDAAVRYLREPLRCHLVASVAWMGFGLAFAELALLAYIPVALVSVKVYFASGSLSQRIRHLWGGRRLLVVAHAVVVLAYVAIYLTTAWASQARAGRRCAVGGLRHERPRDRGAERGDRRTTLMAPGMDRPVPRRPGGTCPAGRAGRIVGLVALSVHVRDSALRAWSIPVIQLVALLLLIAQTRVLFGPALILDLRVHHAAGPRHPPGRRTRLPEGAGRVETSAPSAALAGRPRDPPLSSRRPSWSLSRRVERRDVPSDAPAGRPVATSLLAAFERSLNQHAGAVDLVDLHLPDYV